MTVYADEVFLLNFLIDWLLLQLSVALTGQHCAGLRLALAALAGAVYAVLALLVPALALLPVRLAMLALMACLAFGFGRQALKPGLWYLGVCCGFCGLVYAVSVLRGHAAFLRGGSVWYAVRLHELVLLAGGTLLLVRLLLPRISQHNGAQTLPLTLTLNGRSIRLTALRDTGNTLRDPISGQPVLVADPSVFCRLLPQLPLTQRQLATPVETAALLHELAPWLHPRLLPYHTVGTGASLLLALLCELRTRQHPDGRPVLVAFSPTPVSDGGLYQALSGGMLC